MITSRRGVHRGSISAGARQVGRSGSPAHLERSSRRSGGTFDRNLGEQVPGDARTHVADADGADSLHECRHLSRSSSQPSAATPSRRRSGNAAPSKDFPRRGDTTWPGNEPRTSSCDARADEPEQLRDLAVRPKHGDGHIRTVRIETPARTAVRVPSRSARCRTGNPDREAVRGIRSPCRAAPSRSDASPGGQAPPGQRAGARAPTARDRHAATGYRRSTHRCHPVTQRSRRTSRASRILCSRFGRSFQPGSQRTSRSIRQELQIELGRDRPGQRGLPTPRATDDEHPVRSCQSARGLGDRDPARQRLLRRVEVGSVYDTHGSTTLPFVRSWAGSSATHRSCATSRDRTLRRNDRVPDTG